MAELNLEVCLSPALLHLHDIRKSIVVIIDIFRASSSICYGIENGAIAIIPVESVEVCNSYRGTDFLLAAERNGEVVDGFDFGNSPFAYRVEKVLGKTIVLSSTNGTRAIHASMEADIVVIGSFLNLNTLCNWLCLTDKPICLLCSGWKNKINLEDTLFAGAVVDQLKEYHKPDDAAIMANDLYTLAKDNLQEYLQKSSHSNRLKKLHIEEDIAFCLQRNLTTSIPILKDGKLIKMDLK